MKSEDEARALQPTFHRRAGALLLFVSAWPMLVFAQPHETTRGDYTLRSSTVASTAIPAPMARERGIQPGGDRAILNVVLLRRQDGADRPVPASVEAEVSNLAGMTRRVDMRAARANGQSSYFGTFIHGPGEVLDIRIQARPEGAGGSLELSYRERMPRQ